MNENIKLCEYCYKEHDGSYGSGRFCSRHCVAKYVGSKSNIHGKLTGHKPTYHPKPSNKLVEFTCPYCGKTFFKTHLQKASHIKWCTNNPNHSKYKEQLKTVRESRKGHSSWNKGLTKETDERVRKQAETFTEHLSSGKFRNVWIGRHHSEETKRKISEIGRNNPYQRKCKKTLPYTKLDGTVVNLDSSYERFVAKFLDDHNIEWERTGIFEWVDSTGKKHHYFPDFYIPKLNIYLDPKNEYCFEAQKEKIEYIKTHYNNVIFISHENLNNNDLEKILAEHTIKTLDNVHQV